MPLVTGTATATFQNLGSNVSPSDCIAGPVVAATEPGTLALLAGALLAFGGVGLRRCRRGLYC